MTQFVIANNVNTQLAAPVTSSATTLTLASSANLPPLNTSIGQMMPLTLNDAATGNYYEVVYVTAISGVTLTVLRAQEGTGALNWNVGDYAFCGPTAGTVGLTTMRTQYQASAAYSSSQTLTAAIAGESVGFTGGSASVFSMPSQSAVPTLTPTSIYNDGSAALTITANGTDKFVVATGQVASIVMQPGDDLSFYASTTAGLWTAASGSALRQFEPLIVGAATASGHAVQLGQVSGIVGATRNLVMNVAAASATATLTADEIIVETALGGLRYCLANFNKTINLATTGAGGMDTGTAPVSGYVALYAIWNPTTATAALLATNATSAIAPSVYGGAYMPAGYTASGLVSVVPTNASSQFIVMLQRDRTIALPPALVLSSSTNQATATPLNIASTIPQNAKKISGSMLASTTVSSAITVNVSGSSGRVGEQGMNGNATAIGGAFAKIDLAISQTMYYLANAVSGTPSYSLYVSAYEI